MGSGRWAVAGRSASPCTQQTRQVGKTFSTQGEEMKNQAIFDVGQTGIYWDSQMQNLAGIPNMLTEVAKANLKGSEFKFF